MARAGRGRLGHWEVDWDPAWQPACGLKLAKTGTAQKPNQLETRIFLNDANLTELGPSWNLWDGHEGRMREGPLRCVT